MRKLIVSALRLGTVALGVITLAGCNTVHGLGQDISTGGKALSRSATETKQDIDSNSNSNSSSSSSSSSDASAGRTTGQSVAGYTVEPVKQSSNT